LEDAGKQWDDPEKEWNDAKKFDVKDTGRCCVVM